MDIDIITLTKMEPALGNIDVSAKTIAPVEGFLEAMEATHSPEKQAAPMDTETELYPVTTFAGLSEAVQSEYPQDVPEIPETAAADTDMAPTDSTVLPITSAPFAIPVPVEQTPLVTSPDSVPCKADNVAKMPVVAADTSRIFLAANAVPVTNPVPAAEQVATPKPDLPDNAKPVAKPEQTVAKVPSLPFPIQPETPPFQQVAKQRFIQLKSDHPVDTPIARAPAMESVKVAPMMSTTSTALPLDPLQVPLAQTNLTGEPPFRPIELPHGLDRSLRFETTTAASRPTGPALEVLGQVVNKLSSRGEQRIDIRLDPPELGRVTVSLSPNESTVHATIFAERPEVLDLMRRHADILAAALEEAGYATANLDFQNGEGSEDSDQKAGDQAVLVGEHALPGAVSDSRITIIEKGRLDIRL